MSIQLNCKCGRYFELDDGSAGRSIQCPACDAQVAVPSAGDPARHTADAYSGVQAATTPGNGWGKSQTHSDNDYDYNTAGEERRRPVEIDQRFVRNDPPPAATGGFGGINAGVGGGLLMMVLAVVWFFGALLLVDRIFFYPPILFVLGLIAFFKGLANSTR